MQVHLRHLEVIFGHASESSDGMVVAGARLSAIGTDAAVETLCRALSNASAAVQPLTCAGPLLVVVGVCEGDVPLAVRHVFEAEVQVGPPRDAERQQLLRFFLHKMRCTRQVSGTSDRVGQGYLFVLSAISI